MPHPPNCDCSQCHPISEQQKPLSANALEYLRTPSASRVECAMIELRQVVYTDRGLRIEYR